MTGKQIPEQGVRKPQKKTSGGFLDGILVGRDLGVAGTVVAGLDQAVRRVERS